MAGCWSSRCRRGHRGRLNAGCRRARSQARSQACAHQCAHALYQHMGLKGLDHMPISTTGLRSGLIEGLVIVSEKHHRHLRGVGIAFETPADVVAAHPGHADVDEGDIWRRCLFGARNRLLAVADGYESHIFACKGNLNNLSHGDAIVGK